jgi:hypothetical protein
MAKTQGKGSIVLKLLILILVVVLILAINLPGEIWTQEESLMSSNQRNMSSIYEAHRHYYSNNAQYTTDISELTHVIENDSALILRQDIVNHTLTLRDAMEEFLNIPVIYSLNQISSNIKNIEEDFDTNERYFKSQDPEILEKKIFETSQELKLQLSTFRSGVEYENYRSVVANLDSLWQLRRNLTDYSLQSAARRATSLSQVISQNIQNIDFKSMETVWSPLSNRLTSFLNTVNSVEKLKTLTTIADRVADFQDEISSGFKAVNSLQPSRSYQAAQDATAQIEQVYQTFLADFLVTESFAQYSLSETDSLLINLSEDNFFSPRDRQPYIVTFEDTAGLTVEDPTLLAELKDMATKEAESAKQLPIIQSFSEYEEGLDSLQQFYMMVKKQYRRNLDITIKTKELDDVIDKTKEVLAYESYSKLKAFAEEVPSSNSYSQIKAKSEDALVSVGSFIQIYENNIFGNLDTVHIKIVDHLNEFNQILSKIRRNRYSFDWAIDNLSSSLTKIKSIPTETVIPSLKKIEENLKVVFLFASEGKEIPVYGVFKTKIVNNGKVYGTTGRKSWEEE